MKEDILPYDHMLFFIKLGQVYYNLRNFKKSEFFYIKALSFEKEIDKNYYSDYNKIHNKLGLLYIETNDYVIAEKSFKTALDLERKISQSDTTLTCARIIYNLATLYSKIGDIKESEKLYLEVLNIAEKLENYQSKKYYSDFLNGLAVNYSRKGEYRKSEEFYFRSMKTLKDSFGENNLSYANLIANLAEFYLSLGNFQKSELFYTNALTIVDSIIGRENLTYSAYLGGLGRVYLETERIVQATDLFLESLQIEEKQAGIESINYLHSLNNLAYLYTLIDEYNSAEVIYKKMINAYNTFGEFNLEYIVSLNNLANIYSQNGKYHQAETLFIEALQIAKTQRGIKNLEIEPLRYNLAALYYKMGKLDKVAFLLSEIRNMNFNYIREHFLFLSKKEQDRLLNKLHNKYDGVLSLVFKSGTSEMLRIGYDFVLFQKEILLNNLKILNTQINNINNIELQNIHKEMSIAFAKRNQLLLNPISQTEVETLEMHLEKLEKTLFTQLPEYKEAIEELDVRWKQVQAEISNKSAVIEFTHFRNFFSESTDSTLYAAFVIRPEYEHPKMVILGEASDLNNILNVDINEASQIKKLYSRTRGGTALGTVFDGEALYNFAWSKIDSLLEGVEKVYYAPSGDLHRVAFAGLPISKDSVLSQKYELHQLGTTRQLVSGIPDITAPQKGEWLIAGGLEYDKLPLSLEVIDTISYNFNRRIYSREENRSTRQELEFLKGTKEEAEQLSIFLQRKNIDIGHKLLRGNEACEEYFHDDNRFQNVPVIHIGTHGFFLPPLVKEEKPTSGFIPTSGEQFQHIDYPMLRSGLMLSGAELAWKENKTYPNRMDGIWTAQEISQLNLKNTSLAVLSACQTGLGDIEGNEGVYGLQRAFQLAGVDKLLVSLWNVNDTATNEYMQTFYSNWLAGGTAYEAYKETQTYFQQHPKKEYRNPYYWAGFVLLE